MTTKYGMFAEHAYLRPSGAAAPADGTQAEDVQPTEQHGLSMKATVGRTGKGNDAVFSKFTSLHEGDPYVDPMKARLKAEAEQRKKRVVDKPFKTASPIPKSSTPGDFYGTSEKVAYIPGHVDEIKKKGEITHTPKGIYTSPAKKGGLGYDKLTISQRVGPKGIATEYEYQHDPESVHVQQRRDAQAAERKARVTELPFKPANPPKKGGFGVPNTTISKGKGVAGEWEYVPTAQQPGDAAAADVHAGEKKDLTPFKPSNVFASQRIEPIPYIHDPEAPKLKAESDKRMAESKRLATTGPWRPTQGDKTDMVRSIVRMNLR